MLAAQIGSSIQKGDLASGEGVDVEGAGGAGESSTQQVSQHAPRSLQVLCGATHGIVHSTHSAAACTHVQDMGFVWEEG